MMMFCFPDAMRCNQGQEQPQPQPNPSPCPKPNPGDPGKPTQFLAWKYNRVTVSRIWAVATSITEASF